MVAKIEAFENEENVEKIIRYYSKKDTNPENTKRFVEESKLGQESGGYKEVFKAFKEAGGEPDEQAFYGFIKQYIDERKKKCETEFTKRLKYLDEVPDEELLCSGEVPNQKWHFLVSWYAYKKLLMQEKNSSGDRIFCDKNMTKATGSPGYYYFWCKELIIWLAEVIVEDKPEFQTTFDQIYKEAENDAKAGIKWSCKQAVAIEFLDEIFKTVLSITNNNVN